MPNAEPMKVVYVVGFSPDFTHWHGDNARVGGFDWRVDFFAARKVMLHHLNEDTGHDYVMRSVQVPRSLNGDEITDYLCEHVDLWEIPLPADWYNPSASTQPEN